MPTVDFEVEPSEGVQGYWIAVGDEDVRLENGKGSIELEGPEKHTLIWWFIGEEGETLSVTGKDGEHVVVEVKESKIPSGETEGAGARKFTV